MVAEPLPVSATLDWTGVGHGLGGKAVSGHSGRAAKGSGTALSATGVGLKRPLPVTLNCEGAPGPLICGAVTVPLPVRLAAGFPLELTATLPLTLTLPLPVSESAGAALGLSTHKAQVAPSTVKGIVLLDMKY